MRLTAERQAIIGCNPLSRALQELSLYVVQPPPCPALPSTTDQSNSHSQVAIARDDHLLQRSWAWSNRDRRLLETRSKRPEAVVPGGDGAGLEKVSLQLNWYPEAEHGGFYAALVHGYFKEAGLEVEIRSGGHNTPVAGEIITGRADFAVANAEDVVLYRNEGADAVVVMTAAQHHPRCLLMRTDSGVKSLRDLKGMTLEVIDGQPYLEFMRKEGLLEGVKLVPYFGSVAKTVADPKTGQQGYSFSEPLLARQQGAEISTFMISDLGFDPYSSVLATSGATIKKRPEVVRKMVAASIKGWQKYLSDPKKQTPISSSRTSKALHKKHSSTACRSSSRCAYRKMWGKPELAE